MIKDSGSGGFTLLEVMITIGIIAILMAAGSAVLNNDIKLFNEKERRYEAVQNARVAMSRIAEELRIRTLLVFENESIRGDGTLILSEADTQAVIYFDSGNRQLIMKDNNGYGQVLADNISAFDIASTIDLPVLTISITPVDGDTLVSEFRKDRRPGNGNGNNGNGNNGNGNNGNGSN